MEVGQPRRMRALVESAARAWIRPAAVVRKAYWFLRGLTYARETEIAAGTAPWPSPSRNDLQSYFDSVDNGPGIWKWLHYFDVYERHLAKFRGKDVNILEIGIYSGGSLSMWKWYFGSRCRVYGVDIEEGCKIYEADRVDVFIGDQADRAFWKTFKENVPPVDVIIDDGGHEVRQQVTTLEELFPHLRPGGVYLCEDIHGVANDFGFYLCGLSRYLNGNPPDQNPDDRERRLVAKAIPFQSEVNSMHLYPFVAVIEKRDSPVAEFVAPMHGTQWQPFLE